MADLFDIHQKPTWSYTAVASTILQGTAVGTVATSAPASGGDGNQYAMGPVVRPLHGPEYWASVQQGFDFSKEDRIDPELFNHVLWKGVMGDKPYPGSHTAYIKAADAAGKTTVADADGDDD
jgi:hypothetical protein